MSSDLLKRVTRGGKYELIETSNLLNAKDDIRMMVPVLNLALSGDFKIGLETGTTTLAGPSSSFKTALLLYFIKAFQDKYPDGTVFFVDSEGGTNPNMLENFGIDLSRVIYIDVEHIHDAHHKIMDLLVNFVKPEDNVFLAFDSIGNIPTAGEVKRAMDDKITADVGNRPKELKAMFRTISRPIRKNGVYAVFLNHTYDPPEQYAKRVMGGGGGPMYDSQRVIFLDKRALPKELRRAGITGDNRFNIYVHKSRKVVDRSEFFIDVYQGKGIDPLSCLEDLAKEAGTLKHHHGQWWDYAIGLDIETGEIEFNRVSKNDMQNAQFWGKMLNNELFLNHISDTYLMNIDDSIMELDDDIFKEWDKESEMEDEEIVDVGKAEVKKTKSKKEPTG